MNRGQQITILGGFALLIGAFLPWISVPDLFGLSGPGYEGIAVGWEGDGAVTGGIGLLLILGALLFKGRPGKITALVGVVLAALADFIILADVLRIIELDPVAGIFASTSIGLYVTAAGALFALVGCLFTLLLGETEVNKEPNMSAL